MSKAGKEIINGLRDLLDSLKNKSVNKDHRTSTIRVVKNEKTGQKIVSRVVKEKGEDGAI
jgi:hypothetical protein